MSYGRRKEFYHSVAWKNCRAAYLASVGGLCEDCLQRGLITPAVIVHHVNPLQEDFTAEQALNWNNLRAVCRLCHATEHEQRAPRRYSIADDGAVIID